MPKTSLSATAVLLFAIALLSACGSKQIESQAPISPLSEQATTLLRQGPVDYQIASGRHISPTGCQLSYNTYVPQQRQTDAMVLLAHGLYQSMQSMRSWADHWASFGVPVTIVSLCDASLFNPKIERNATDLISLANALHQGPVLYAGYSAGGLAALVAAGNDPRTQAYLGLDSVDSNNLATKAVGSMDFPAMLLVAEPAFCNADNNIVQDFTDYTEDEIQPTVFRVRNATHCYFSSYLTGGCSRICGTIEEPATETAVLETIRSLATAWVLEHTLTDLAARDILTAARQGQTPWQERIILLD